MSTDRQRAILEAVASGEGTPEEAFERLEIEALIGETGEEPTELIDSEPVSDLGDEPARPDQRRKLG